MTHQDTKTHEVDSKDISGGQLGEAGRHTSQKLVKMFR